MDQIDLRAALGRLAQALRDQRMVLAQEGADHQHAVERADLGDRHAQPGRAGPLAVGGEIGLAQAEVDVVAAEAAHQLAEQVQFFERGMRRGERADAPAAPCCA